MTLVRTILRKNSLSFAQHPLGGIQWGDERKSIPIRFNMDCGYYSSVSVTTFDVSEMLSNDFRPG